MSSGLTLRQHIIGNEPDRILCHTERRMLVFPVVTISGSAGTRTVRDTDGKASFLFRLQTTLSYVARRGSRA
jgi:hypothetical protein